MRNWLIEALGGVTQTEQDFHSKSTNDLIIKLQQIINHAQNELNTTKEGLRAALACNEGLHAECTTIENERDHLKRANETLHKTHDEDLARINDLAATNLGLENRILALNSSNAELRGAASEPKRKYKLDARVQPQFAGFGGKVTSYALHLLFTENGAAPSIVEVRSLAASKKSKNELDKIALQINSTVERFVNL